MPSFMGKYRVTYIHILKPSVFLLSLLYVLSFPIYNRNYKALIGGYLHYALADLTGFIPQQIVMQSGHVGYEEAATRDLWRK